MVNLAESRQEDREFLEELLPKGAHKHIDKILNYFEPIQVDAVEIRGGRVAIEEVTIYGLVIGVDANGNASTVDFPYGADVTEVSA